MVRIILKDVHQAFLGCMAALFSNQFINFLCLWKFQVKACVCLGLIFSLSIAIIDVSMQLSLLFLIKELIKEKKAYNCNTRSVTALVLLSLPYFPHKLKWPVPYLKPDVVDLFTYLYAEYLMCFIT